MPKRIWSVKEGKHVYEVDPDRWLCSCGEEECEHRSFVASLQEGDKGMSYVAVSAMHKEIRRGAVGKALHWAEWLRHTRGGDYAVKSYLRGILFEESRNTTLWEKWQDIGAQTGDEMIKEFAGSKKQWELTAAQGKFMFLVEADLRNYGLGFPEREEIERPPKRDKFEFFHWVALLHRIAMANMKVPRNKRNQTWRMYSGVLGRTLRRELVNEGYELEAAVIQKTQGYHELMQGIEALCGMVDERGCEITKIKPTLVEVDLLMPPDYVYDSHTRKGKGKVARLLKYMKPGRPQPATLDLRWTGANLGCWWRFRAFEQHGAAYRNKKWEDVEASAEEWRKVVSSDKIWRGQRP